MRAENSSFALTVKVPEGHQRELYGRVPIGPIRCLELELEGELDGAGAADLVKGVEAAIRPAGAQAVRQRLCRVAEEGIRKRADGTAEVRVVEDVEELGPETQAQLLGQVKLPLHGKVGLPSSKAAEDVASEIALGTARRRGEGRFVVAFAAGILRAKEHERHAWDYIRTGIESDAGSKDHPGDHVDRGS